MWLRRLRQPDPHQHSHYLNYNAVLVRLSRVRPDTLRDLLGMAHEFVTADAGRRHGTAASRLIPAPKSAKAEYARPQ